MNSYPVQSWGHFYNKGKRTDRLWEIWQLSNILLLPEETTTCFYLMEYWKNTDSYFVSFPLSSDEDASFEPFAHNLPMLLALAHKENITKSSSFYRVRGTKTSCQENVRKK